MQSSAFVRLISNRPVLTHRNVAIRLPEAAPSKIDFKDTELAFATKTSGELFRAWAVLYGCTFSSLTKRADTLYNLSLKVFGGRFVHAVIEKTLFRHFCAGTNQMDITRPIQRLNAAGVGGILDYAAESKENDEEDVVEGKLPLQSKAQARVHSYSSESKCDANMKIFKHAVKAVKEVSPNGFASIKLSALGEPALMERMSVALVEIETLFSTLSCNETNLSFDQFVLGWNQLFITDEKVRDKYLRDVYDRFDANRDDAVDIVDWLGSMSLMDLSELVNSCKEKGPLYTSALTSEELRHMSNLLARCDDICHMAYESNVRVMIDAEWSAIQPAIDNITLHMQKKYNQSVDPIVFSTYQTYLVSSQVRARRDLDRARREGWTFGAKIVRGAYMIGERERARKLGIPSPIWDRYSQTEKNYHEVLALCLEDSQAEVMVASHNERTMQFVVAKMKQVGKNPNHVYFGQLLGMADHLTFTLAANKFNAYKYIPYGPVDEVMPYLIRRTQENSTLLGSPAVVDERKMIFREICRRFFSFRK